MRGESDLSVVGEAEDGLIAVNRVRELQPDLVLMDLNMPNMDGIEATRRIHAEFPEVQVIALTMFDDPEKEALMRQAGAVGYMAKGGPLEDLFAAIRACCGR